MIAPQASLDDNRANLKELKTSGEPHQSQKPSSYLNQSLNRSVYIEVAAPSTGQGISGTQPNTREPTSSNPPTSSQRCKTRSTERSIRLTTGGSSCTSARLTTTDLLRVNEVLRRENERLRLRLLRAQAADAGGDASGRTADSEPPSLSVPPSSVPSSVRSATSRLRCSRNGGAAPLPPPPPSGKRSAATPATPATPATLATPTTPLLPPRPAASRSPFVGFFRHCTRPCRPGAGNLSELRFREWVGHAPTLF